MISVPVVVTSSRTPDSAEPLKKFVTHAPVNLFPEPLANVILRISIALAARIDGAWIPIPAVEDQVRTDPGGNAAKAVTFPWVSWVVPIAEPQSGDLRSIARFVGIAPAEAMPAKSAIIRAIKFLYIQCERSFCERREQTVCQEMFPSVGSFPIA